MAIHGVSLCFVGTGIAVLAITNRKMMPYGGLGRRGVMVCGGLAFLLGALLQASAKNWSMLIFGRIFLGVGIGFANEVRIIGKSNHCTCVM